jgi:mannose-6-phosphate isomerase-like protein (cupin superfamily)
MAALAVFPKASIGAIIGMPTRRTGAEPMDKADARYDIATDEILFAPGEHIDAAAVAADHTPWWNRTLCAVNNAWVRLAVMEGDFHWHKHDAEDEFFFVLEGRLDLELEDRTVRLDPMQGFTVSRGTMHFPHTRPHGGADGRAGGSGAGGRLSR